MTCLPAAFDQTLSDLLGAHWRTDPAALAAHAQDNSWRHALPLGDFKGIGQTLRDASGPS